MCPYNLFNLLVYMHSLYVVICWWTHRLTPLLMYWEQVTMNRIVTVSLAYWLGVLWIYLELIWLRRIFSFMWVRHIGFHSTRLTYIPIVSVSFPPNTHQRVFSCYNFSLRSLVDTDVERTLICLLIFCFASCENYLFES